MDTYLHFCPRCGRQDLDRDVHGSPGTALCRACGTLFAILSVRFGERMVVLGGAKEADAKVATASGPVPEDPSTETTLPIADDGTKPDDSRERTLRITNSKKSDD